MFILIDSAVLCVCVKLFVGRPDGRYDQHAHTVSVLSGWYVGISQEVKEHLSFLTYTSGVIFLGVLFFFFLGIITNLQFS